MSDEEIEEPIAPERDHRSIIELIDHLEYLVHRAQRVPFTHNVMIDEDEILDLLDQIHVNMPEEIKQSRTVLAEQERLLSEAQQESARITQTAAQKAEGMVTNHELARKAEDERRGDHPGGATALRGPEASRRRLRRGRHAAARVAPGTYGGHGAEGPGNP